VAALVVGEAREVGGGYIRGVDVSPALKGSIDPTWTSIVPLFFGLVAESGGHREISTRSARGNAAWQNVFDIYFNPIHGAGRAFTMWTNRRDGLNKFRKAVLGALEFHAAAFDVGESAPTQVQILANDLRVERNNAIAAHDAAVAQREQHQGILLAANRGMGLVPLGRGVSPPPNLGFAINRNQELALSELAHRTQSVDSTRGGVSLGGSNGNRSNSISLESLDDEDHLEVEIVGNLLPAGLAAATPTPTAHTPAAGQRAHASIAFVGNLPAGLAAATPTPTAHTPAAGQRAHASIAFVGNLPAGLAAAAPTPTAHTPAAGQRAHASIVGNLPAGLAAAAPTPTVHTPAVHTPTPVTAAGGINLGVIAGNQAGQRAQANVAAGNIGDPQVFPSGVRTSRNLDQVTLLAHMNQEVARGIAHLNSFLPRDDERRQSRLEAAITCANQRLSAAIANGRPTANILQQIERLENQLDAILNSI